MGRQAMVERYRQPNGPTGRPAFPGGKEKEGGSVRFDPPKSGFATDSAEQNVLSNHDQLRHAPPTLKWVGTNEGAARPKTWVGVAFTTT